MNQVYNISICPVQTVYIDGPEGWDQRKSPRGHLLFCDTKESLKRKNGKFFLIHFC